jgi:hypothetical protein
MSGFTTFLSKLGKALAVGLSIATGVGPLLQPYLGSKASTVVGTTVNDLTAIGQVVTTAEALIQTPGSGPTKLAAAAPLVAQIIQTSELVAGHKITNEILFTKACQEITSAVADLLNSLDANAVQTSGQPLPVLPVPVTPAGS